MDIGCGDGKVTAIISSYLSKGNIIGIDSSENMIALARNSFLSKDYPNLSFRQMDAGKLIFKNQFDVIFSNATLHWIKDQAAVLKGVKNSLNKNGKILFQMGGKGNAKDVLGIADTVIKYNKWKIYFDNFVCPYNFCSPVEYRTWLNEAGIKPIRAELIVKDMKQKGKDGFAGWIKTTWMPYLERIPENKRDDFVSDIVDLYIEKYPIDTEGYIHIKMVRLEIEAINP